MSNCWSSEYDRNLQGLEMFVSDLWMEGVYFYEEIINKLTFCQNMVLQMEAEYHAELEKEKETEKEKGLFSKIKRIPSYTTSKYKYHYA